MKKQTSILSFQQKNATIAFIKDAKHKRKGKHKQKLDANHKVTLESIWGKNKPAHVAPAPAPSPALPPPPPPPPLPVTVPVTQPVTQDKDNKTAPEISQVVKRNSASTSSVSSVPPIVPPPPDSVSVLSSSSSSFGKSLALASSSAAVGFTLIARGGTDASDNGTKEFVEWKTCDKKDTVVRNTASVHVNPMKEIARLMQNQLVTIPSKGSSFCDGLYLFKTGVPINVPVNAHPKIHFIVKILSFICDERPLVRLWLFMIDDLCESMRIPVLVTLHTLRFQLERGDFLAQSDVFRLLLYIDAVFEFAILVVTYMDKKVYKDHNLYIQKVSCFPVLTLVYRLWKRICAAYHINRDDKVNMQQVSDAFRKWTLVSKALVADYAMPVITAQGYVFALSCVLPKTLALSTGAAKFVELVKWNETHEFLNLEDGDYPLAKESRFSSLWEFLLCPGVEKIPTLESLVPQSQSHCKTVYADYRAFMEWMGTVLKSFSIPANAYNFHFCKPGNCICVESWTKEQRDILRALEEVDHAQIHRIQSQPSDAKSKADSLSFSIDFWKVRPLLKWETIKPCFLEWMSKQIARNIDLDLNNLYNKRSFDWQALRASFHQILEYILQSDGNPMWKCKPVPECTPNVLHHYLALHRQTSYIKHLDDKEFKKHCEEKKQSHPEVVPWLMSGGSSSSSKEKTDSFNEYLSFNKHALGSHLSGADLHNIISSSQ